MTPPGWHQPLERWRTRAVSPEIALAQLVMGADGAPVLPTLRALAVGDAGLRPLLDLAELQADRLAALERMVAEGLDPAPADTPNASLAATAALFDRLAASAPEAAVAIYSLGDPAVLARATDELVAVIEAWCPHAGRDVLDWGCGTGRVSAALAPHARSVLGVDLSAGMLAEAARRHGAVPNLEFRYLPDPSGLDEGAFDVLLAVDSLPFAVAAGGNVAAQALADFHRMLRPHGDLLVFNWSYRGDPAADEADARAVPGFEVVRVGERPFRLWDGVGFHLRRV